MTPEEVRAIVQEEIAKGEVKLQGPYIRTAMPQPEFGESWPKWSLASHISYLYRIMRRREERGRGD